MAEHEEPRLSAEAIELRKIRDRVGAIAGTEWLLSSDGEVTFVEARSNGECNEIARFNSIATTDEVDFLANAPHMVSFLLGLVDRAITAARNGRPRTPAQAQGKAVNYAAEAAMKCDEAAFLIFLEERHGLERPLTAEPAVQRLRSVLGITSRKELNDNSEAAGRWRTLRADYDMWRRAGQ